MNTRHDCCPVVTERYRLTIRRLHPLADPGRVAGAQIPVRLARADAPHGFMIVSHGKTPRGTPARPGLG
jgi:hypothetical protein